MPPPSPKNQHPAPPAGWWRKLTQFVGGRHTWLSGGKEYGALPSTIRAAIKRQQDGSERLIGWIQLAILAAFAALYFAAPKTAPTGAEFEPVPVFLGVYFAFTCLRLWMAYKTSLPPWILVLSALADMALLLGLIWCFHLQYAQPPSFYLKAPTLLYIFIFIALRALRFEPGFVVLSGLIGSAGWLVLVGYAVMGEAGTSMITRNYVEYLTSNSESTTAENLSHFVPEGIADRIAATEGPLINAQTETREATILFSDLVSFTSMSERLSPDQLIATVNEYFTLVSEPIERNNGVIIMFQGDALMASFNLPSIDVEHATSAVAAAVEIGQCLENHRFSTGVKLQARIGINTGKVVGGFAGAKERLNYTLYGDQVNIAARLEQLNKQRGTSILVAERTVELSDQKRFRYAPKGSEVLRGRQAAINVFTPVTEQQGSGT